MITYKCRKCGGEMSISPAGELVCAYCGTKENFSDAELRGYREFRNSMLQYLAAAAGKNTDTYAAEQLWSYAETKSFQSDDGEAIEIKYLFTAVDDGIEMYMAKESVIYVFPAGRAKDAQKMLENIAKMQYPKADMKGLANYVPSLIARFDLNDDGALLVFKKSDNMYPLGAFGKLEYIHAAWVLSRLENLCCMLEFSNLCHGGITLEGIFIDPYTHEAALYGGWWKATPERNGSKVDLKSIRAVIDRLLGVDKKDVPKGFLDFLKSAPAMDAYTDFGEWDQVIETKMGGRHFHKLTLDQVKKES
ncbi:MAG: TFIIB-type zinc ribbon-containing protein [Acetatifactor sp.]|nr:TFIIB-type zinc ribbon-containing protein [Acetatifactor sp.]